MTYGKIFSSLYKGSMIGAGPLPFAIMGYVISNAMPDRNLGGYVQLHPIVLASTIGKVTPEQVSEAIEFLCAPDPLTTTPGDEGRRLVKIGPFDYRVVNYAKYKAIRDEEERREQNRLAQEKHRQKKKEAEEKRAAKKSSKPKSAPDQSGTQNAKLIEEAMARGDESEAERLQAMWDKGLE